MIAGSKVMSEAASASTRGEMPCASASFLKAASHCSKLAVLRQRGAAKAGPASRPIRRTASHFRSVVRIGKAALYKAGRDSAQGLVWVKRQAGAALKTRFCRNDDGRLLTFGAANFHF